MLTETKVGLVIGFSFPFYWSTWSWYSFRVGNYPQNLLSADSDIRTLFFADTLRISDIKKSII